MVTKKTAASTRKTTKKPASSTKKTTKVTTVKASAASSRRAARFTLKGAPLLTASLAEFIGTFLLAAIVIVTSGQPLFVMFGLLAIILTLGGVAGGHFNPAITVGALATRRIGLKRALSLIAAQVLGALLALVVLNSFIGAAPEVTEQAQAYGQSAPTLFSLADIAKGKEWVVLAAELLGTTIFAFGAATALRSRSLVTKAGTFASVLYISILVAGTAASYVGSSAVLNPAVATALQAFKEFELWTVMVYALTPLVGGVLGFALNDLLRSDDQTE